MDDSERARISKEIYATLRSSSKVNQGMLYDAHVRFLLHQIAQLEQERRDITFKNERFEQLEALERAVISAGYSGAPIG